MSDHRQPPQGAETSFGAQLRALRVAKQWSLRKLAIRASYAPGYLSRIENGRQEGNAALARRCDEALGTGNLLQAALAGERIGPLELEGLLTEQEITTFRAVRALVEGPATTMLPLRGEIGPEAIAEIGGIFTALRQLGQFTHAGSVALNVEAMVRTLTAMATAPGRAYRVDLLLVAARFSEYLGWMAQEVGQDDWAVRWTQHAVSLARPAGVDLTVLALLRECDLALSRGDHRRTVDIATVAVTRAADDRVRGFAAQRLAQGFALAGLQRECEQALEDTRQHFAAAQTGGTASGTTGGTAFAAVGSTMVADHAAMTVGVCLVDLGRPEEAVPILARELDRVPQFAVRAWARHAARLARGLAASGEVTAAFEMTQKVIQADRLLGSATARAELRQLRAHTPLRQTSEGRRLVRLLAEAA